MKPVRYAVLIVAVLALGMIGILPVFAEDIQGAISSIVINKKLIVLPTLRKNTTAYEMYCSRKAPGCQGV